MGAGPEAASLEAGRIVVPGTDRQLAAYGLFPPSAGQHQHVTAASHSFAVKASVPELLWICFEELCAPVAAAADYARLAALHPLWVVDGVPVPVSAAAAAETTAWTQFAAALDALAGRNNTLFVVGSRPMDWAEAAAGATDTRLRAALEAIAWRLERMIRVESDETIAAEGVSGS